MTVPKIWSIRFKEHPSSINPAAFSFPFSHLRLSRYSLRASEWQQCSQSSFVLFLEASGKGDEWAWRMIYRKTKAGMKSKRQKQENNICVVAGGSYRPRTQPVIYQWNITLRICVKACAVSIYDMCGPSEEENRLITPSPLSPFNLLCPKGILQFPRHPWPNTEILLNRRAFQHR